MCDVFVSTVTLMTKPGKRILDHYIRNVIHSSYHDIYFPMNKWLKIWRDILITVANKDFMSNTANNSNQTELCK